jgi:hypothetical protein
MSFALTFCGAGNRRGLTRRDRVSQLRMPDAFVCLRLRSDNELGNNGEIRAVLDASFDLPDD